MTVPITRRTMMASALAVLIARHAHAADAAPQPDINARLAEIEAKVKGRLGVAILDTRSGTVYGQREFERFPLCSTFKLLAAAMVLDRVDHKEEQLDRRIVFSPDDVVAYSPITKDRTGGEGMTLAELSAAAVTRSDNTAANLMLDSLGGPKALTRFLRSLGDKATRLDRTEPTLNEVAADDPRDTTTPRAMAYTVQRILIGNVLSKPSEKLLIDWLTSNTTGEARLKAGLPAGWRIGDKTSSCGKGGTNDVAIIWPPNDRAPIIIAAFLADTDAPLEEREAALADVARAATTLA
jgi:beta-lactamase class A